MWRMDITQPSGRSHQTGTGMIIDACTGAFLEDRTVLCNAQFVLAGETRHKVNSTLIA
jgi:hypothetical protein